MKKILYFSSIPWGWIKQRPHFLAEGLARENVVDYYAEMRWREKYYKHPIMGNNLKIINLFKLPIFKYYSIINNFLVAVQLFFYIRRYDLIWVNGRCDIFQFNFLQKKIINKKIIYDCLDDQIEFPSVKSNPKYLERIYNGENFLVKNANVIFCSSKTLSKVISDRYNVDRNIHIVNNGIRVYNDLKTNNFENTNYLIKQTSNNKIITYIGTISEWLDIQLLIEAGEKIDGIEFHLYGPSEIDIPQNRNVKYGGILKHEEVFKAMEVSNALVMPFKINNLIKSVNPVKLYEYIYSRKVVLASDYEETKQFEKYVYLYKSSESFMSFCKKISFGNLNPKVSSLECQEFCKENTWEKRIEEINEFIDSLDMKHFRL